ncbi:MAG TPA: hypothetical protein PLI62_11950, partial [Spirochaetota bacterium]|nr:hypothetical protein [Spirochaetota bacterium]
MNSLKIIMISVFIVFIGLGCSGGGGSAGEGGPGETPAGIAVSDQPATDNSTDIATDVDNQQTDGTASTGDQGTVSTGS